jgi:hypothetical protein
MQVELRRVAPVRAANVVALVSAISAALFALVLLPFVWLFPFPPPPSGADPQPVDYAFRSLILLYPVLGLVFGWFYGLVGAFVYNLIARWTGGLSLTFTGGALDAETPPAT